MTLIGELIPVGIILPALSPVLFGGVLQVDHPARARSWGGLARGTQDAERCVAQGTLVSAACAAAGSSVNFLLGKTYLYERVRELEIFGQPPVKETQWCAGIITGCWPRDLAQISPSRAPTRRYTALSSSISKNGFKAALLLRLAPVLPIPLDAHWCGQQRAPITDSTAAVATP